MKPFVDVVLKGKMYMAQVGGGPIIPPEEPGEPPIISGPPGPWPMPPIYIPPDFAGPGAPAHPIVIPPPGIWGPTDPRPTPPIYLPPVGPPNDPHPEHPIVLPPGSIDGVHPEHPIVIPPPAGPPGEPAHPIVIPPGEIGGGSPSHPIVIPPPPPGQPAHPIVLPPDPPEGQPPQKPNIMENWDVKAYWTPVTGWGVGVFPSESHPGVPAPSAKK